MAGTGCLIAVLLGMLSSAAGAESDVAVLQRAESAFARGLQTRADPIAGKEFFRDASESYKLLVQRGFRNSTLFKDLGNASLLAGDLPQALLAYRAGLLLSPEDHELQINLDFARTQVAYPEATRFGRPPGDLRPPWLPRIAPAWQMLSWTLAYSATWLLLARWWIARSGRVLAAALILAIVAAGLTTNLLLEARRSRLEMLHPVVIIADDGVLMRNGNGLAYPARYDTPLNRGVEARLLYERGRWLQIELSAGEVGWVPAEYALYFK